MTTTKFDMDFSWMSDDQLIELTRKPEEIAHLDQCDKRQLIKELGIRLHNAGNQLKVLAR